MDTGGFRGDCDIIFGKRWGWGGGIALKGVVSLDREGSDKVQGGYVEGGHVNNCYVPEEGKCTHLCKRHTERESGWEKKKDKPAESKYFPLDVKECKVLLI